jgi:hypothetical protein
VKHIDDYQLNKDQYGIQSIATKTDITNDIRRRVYCCQWLGFHVDLQSVVTTNDCLVIRNKNNNKRQIWRSLCYIRVSPTHRVAFQSAVVLSARTHLCFLVIRLNMIVVANRARCDFVVLSGTRCATNMGLFMAWLPG